ncbi:hypothetical protein NHJ13051_007023 [Beauveria bassiana]
MEQKKFLKFGPTRQAFESYVPMIKEEVLGYLASEPSLQNAALAMDVSNGHLQIHAQKECDPDIIWNLHAACTRTALPFKLRHSTLEEEPAHGETAQLIVCKFLDFWILRLGLKLRRDCSKSRFEFLTTRMNPPLQNSDLEKLPPIQRVIRETMRVHSSTHAIVHEATRAIQVPRIG